MFDELGIAADTHVVRVNDRLGIADQNADKATETINARTTPRFKRRAHEWLIQHGMKVCLSRALRCDECRPTRYRNWFAERGAE